MLDSLSKFGSTRSVQFLEVQNSGRWHWAAMATLNLGGLLAVTDKRLICRECGEEFLFTQGEQEFYEKRGLQNEPGRCTQCRASRRKARGGEGESRQMHSVVCASCGKDAEVPFQPRLGKPVYCSECFATARSGQ